MSLEPDEPEDLYDRDQNLSIPAERQILILKVPRR